MAARRRQSVAPRSVLIGISRPESGIGRRDRSRIGSRLLARGALALPDTLRPAATSRPALRAWLGGGVRREPCPLGDDPAELARLQLEPLVAQQRQRDPLAPHLVQVDVDEVQVVVEERRREDRLAGRPDDLRAAPERHRLVDADPVHEHDERRRELRVGPHQRSPRRRRARARPRCFAARSRPGDDETFSRICAPSRASSCGVWRCQKSSHTAMPTPTPRRDGVARTTSPGGEEPALVELAVRRQEHLPVHVPDLAVLHERRRDEQPVVARLLDERHDRRRQRRASPPRARRAAGRRGASRPRRRGRRAGSR